MAEQIAKKVTIGISEILLGDIAEDGGMGQALTKLGDTKEGSCKINFSEAEKTEFKVEEYDDPYYVMHKSGKIEIQFQVMNPTLEAIKRVFGGEIEGDIYKAPNQHVTIEKSLKIVPQSGLGFEFPRVTLSGRFDGEYGRSNILGLDVTATVLKPEKEGEPRFRMVTKK